MPNLPKCEDLIAPSLKLGLHQNKIIKELAVGMRHGDSPEVVLQRLLEDPKLREEAKRFIQYGDLVFSRIEEPQIRERYNKQILEKREEQRQKSQKFEGEKNNINGTVRQARESLESLETNMRQLLQQYRTQIQETLAQVQPINDYQQSRKSLPFLSWLSRFYRSILDRYYRLRGYNPTAAQQELRYLLMDIQNPNRNNEGSR